MCSNVGYVLDDNRKILIIFKKKLPRLRQYEIMKYTFYFIAVKLLHGLLYIL